MAEAKAQKKNGNKVTRYFREVKSEMKKVVWPTKKQVIKNTSIVIAAVVVIGAIIYGLDLAFTKGVYDLIIK